MPLPGSTPRHGDHLGALLKHYGCHIGAIDVIMRISTTNIWFLLRSEARLNFFLISP